MIENTPFSFEEAEEIAEDFEDLVDSEFTLPASGTSAMYLVDAVVVCPFGDADKEQFLEEYYSTKNTQLALARYEGEEYDVILLLSDDEANSSYLGIRKYAGEKGVKYNFPHHESY